MDRNYVRGLNGLRGIAALMVFAEHQIWFTGWLSFGRFGVELFFVLSGYLIVGILSNRRLEIEATRARAWPEIRKFFLHRAFRIFPAYYIALVLGLLLAAIPAVSYIDLKLYPYYITYTTNISFGYVFGDWPRGNIGHLWSLAIEEQFYCIAAPIFLCLSLRFHKMISAIFIVISFGLVAALHILGFSWFTIGMDSIVNFGYIGMGGYLRHQVGCRPGAKDGGMWLGLAVAALLAGSMLLTRHNDGLRQLQYMAMGLVSMLIIGQIAINQNSYFVNLLENRFLTGIGKISYGFYLYQGFTKFPPTGIAFKGIDIIVLVNLAVSLLAAQASWMFLEMPILHLRDRLLRTRSGEGPSILSTVG